jgi:hypothetical protein
MGQACLEAASQPAVDHRQFPLLRGNSIPALNRVNNAASGVIHTTAGGNNAEHGVAAALTVRCGVAAGNDVS